MTKGSRLFAGILLLPVLEGFPRFFDKCGRNGCDCHTSPVWFTNGEVLRVAEHIAAKKDHLPLATAKYGVPTALPGQPDARDLSIRNELCGGF